MQHGNQLEDDPVDEAPAKEHVYPPWWKPGKFNGVLPKAELDEMANADCRFLDEEKP